MDSYTKLLIESDTTDGSTTFVDISDSEHTITPSGNVHHETDQQKFGTTSIYFDGTGDYISVADSSDWTFGSADFTIDFWIQRTRTGVDRFFGQCDSEANATSTSVRAHFHSDDKLSFRICEGAVSHYTDSTTVFSDTDWHHIALVRNGNDLLLFVDGVLDTSTDVTGITVNDASTPVFIGRLGFFPFDLFRGYIDEFRISKGIARWTANFTPPTQPYSEMEPEPSARQPVVFICT